MPSQKAHCLEFAMPKKTIAPLGLVDLLTLANSKKVILDISQSSLSENRVPTKIDG